MHGNGGLDYLHQQSIDNPAAFMTLLGKVLPLQLTGDKDNPVSIQLVKFVAEDNADDPNSI